MWKGTDGDFFKSDRKTKKVQLFRLNDISVKYVFTKGF